MKKLSIVLILTLALALSGCSMLSEDTAPAQDDRLVGIYITTEYIDTFDFEAYFAANAAELVESGGGEISSEDAAKYTERIYAEVTDGKASFPIDGIPFIAAHFDDGGESYVGSDYGDKLTNVHMSINVADNTDTYVLSGELFANPSGGPVSFYCNPVYQQEDGRIYLVPGQGTTGDTGTMSHSISASAESLDKDERDYSIELTLSVTCRYPSDKLAVLLYAADGSLISCTEYAPEDMPETIDAGGAAWAVFEDYTQDYAGEPQVTRQLIAAGDDEGFLSLSLEDGESFYTPRTTTLTAPGSGQT